MNTQQADAVNRLLRLRSGEDILAVYFPKESGHQYTQHVYALIKQSVDDDRRIVADLYLDDCRKWHGIAEHLADKLARYEGSTVPQVMCAAQERESGVER